MTTLPITLTIAGAAALINVWLALRISHLRRLNHISIGHGGNEAVETRMRAHSNFVEYTPLFLILLGLVEAARGPQTWLWIVAILFILARLAHPFGMDRPAPNALRIGGVAITWLCLLGLAAYALVIPYQKGSATPPVSYTASEPGGTKLS
jgi:uncharacterized membrane protein YecN with MAPEG domain